MHGDSIHSRDRLRAVRERASGLQALRDQLRKELVEREKEVEQLTYRLDLLTKVGELFRALMDRLVMDHVKSIEEVVTEGFRAIFTDQRLSFEAEVGTRYNKLSIDFFVRQDDQVYPVRGHPLEAFGGGPASIASLILKVLVLRRLKKYPLLALDESLAAVSADYVSNTSHFLRQLAKKTGISTLLVTHNHGFLEHAVLGYKATQVRTDEGERYLELDRI